ncbi:hypothetical protein CPB86DRAFT_828600 [Serendipita vermifera]|nr:hypothetical protein CPB86DRAFT_828600 [Serendipita vermifera]
MNSSLVLNVDEQRHTGLIKDLSTPFGFERIKIEYVTLDPDQSHKQIIPSKRNHFCYVVSGTGSLLTSGKDEEPALLKVDDCFSFPSHVDERTYTIHVSGGQKMNLLTFIDVQDSSAGPLTTETPSVPTIVDAHAVSKWRRAGINRNKHGFLTSSTDMSLLNPPTPLDQIPKGTIPLNKLPWNVNLKRIPPGTQSSNAHCHSYEDEFVLVLSGKARYWHQGEAPEKVVKKGDCIGWKAGTGICHSLLNDADAPNGEGKKVRTFFVTEVSDAKAPVGEDLVYLVWGDNRRDIDKIHYAAANPPWWTDGMRWLDRPDLLAGPASPSPRNPRPGDEYGEE